MDKNENENIINLHIKSFNFYEKNNFYEHSVCDDDDISCNDISDYTENYKDEFVRDNNIENNNIKDDIYINKYKKLVSNINKKEYDYFNKLTIKKKKYYIKQLKRLKKINKLYVPYRIKLLDMNIPDKTKFIVLNKINDMNIKKINLNDYSKIKSWIDNFMQIPFGIYKSLDISYDIHGTDKCANYIIESKNILDKEIYGMDNVKSQILQMAGVWLNNPLAIGTTIGIYGPMGTGKTTLIKNGLSKILNREFVFIALGGASKASLLNGHAYTYEGSQYGKIVRNLIACKSMNPIFYFDELDKISNTSDGEEITSLLTHITDVTQNNKFQDNYFENIDIDLSKCLFIFSYNDKEKINSILRDRMYTLEIKGYNINDKLIIANNYLIPKIINSLKINLSIEFTKDILIYIINRYTDKEKGVRNLKRCLETIYTKLNLTKLLKNKKNILINDIEIDISANKIISLTYKIVDKLLYQFISKSNEYDFLYY